MDAMTRHSPLLPCRRPVRLGLGLLLAVSPGYATAVFLPAGIAVASAFMAGAATLPGTFVGSFILNIWIGFWEAVHYHEGN